MKPHPNLLAPAGLLFCLAVILAAVHYPQAACVPLLVVGLLAAQLRTAGIGAGGLPGPEQGLRRFLLVLFPVLLIPAFFGWGNLTLLLIKLMFILALCVELGLAISSNLVQFRGPSEDGSTHPIRRSLALALEFPLVFLALLYITLAWAVTSIGGPALLYHLVDIHVGWDTLSFTVARMPLVIAGFFITRSLVALTRESISAAPRTFKNLNEGEVLSLQAITTYVFWVIYTMTALYAIGFDLSHLALIGGGLSVGFGFGMQNVISNFISGLILLFGRSVKPGDIIEMGGQRGVVQKISIRSTVVRTIEGTSVFVPNSHLISNQFLNWSHGDSRVRVVVHVGTGFGVDPQHVTELLLGIVRDHPHILDDPEPAVSLDELGPTQLGFGVKFWVSDLRGAWVASEVRLRVEEAFRREGMEPPHPIYEVRIRSEE